MLPVAKEGSQLRNISYLANASTRKASILFLASVQSSNSNLAILPKIALWYPSQRLPCNRISNNKLQGVSISNVKGNYSIWLPDGKNYRDTSKKLKGVFYLTPHF